MRVDFSDILKIHRDLGFFSVLALLQDEEFSKSIPCSENQAQPVGQVLLILNQSNSVTPRGCPGLCRTALGRFIPFLCPETQPKMNICLLSWVQTRYFINIFSPLNCLTELFCFCSVNLLRAVCCS